jgi:thiamine-monophosphate kinase
VLGKTKRPVLRSGARSGDGLWLAGPVGLAAAGLMALERGMNVPSAAWRRPTARFVKLAGAHAAIDISDGLARDAGHMAKASGVSLDFDPEAIVTRELARAAATLEVSALDLALHGGEDYAILAASPRKLSGFVRVGDVRAGRGVTVGGKRVAARGWDHFV